MGFGALSLSPTVSVIGFWISYADYFGVYIHVPYIPALGRARGCTAFDPSDVSLSAPARFWWVYTYSNRETPCWFYVPIWYLPIWQSVQYSSRSSVVTAKFPAAQSNRSDDISSELYHFGELFTEQVWQINVMIWFRSAIQCWSQYPYCNHVGCLLLKRNKRKFEKNKIHKVKDLLFNIRRKAFSWPSVG